MTSEPISATAEGMPKINRRSFLGSSAAVALPTGALAIVTHTEAVSAAETPRDRVHRLAEELSVAMKDCQREVANTGDLDAIECVVHAERSDGIRPIIFRPIRHFTPDERMDNARHELVAATKARYPDVTDWRVLHDGTDPVFADNSKSVGMCMILGHLPGRTWA